MQMLRTRWSNLVRDESWPVIPLLLIQFLTGAWTLSQGSFFPIYLEERLAYAAVAVASMVSVGQVAGMLSGFLGGLLSDRVGSRGVLLVGVFAMILASLVFQVQIPPVIAALWFLSGLAMGLISLGGSSYLTRMADPRRLGLLSALYALSGTVGGAAGNPIAGRILDTAGFARYGLVGTAVLVVAALLAVWVLPTASADRGGKRLEGHMLLMLRRPVVRSLVYLRFLPTIYYGMSIVLIPLLINHLAGNKTTVAIYTATSLITASLAQLVTGRLADRYGHRWPNIIGFSTLLIAGLGLALFSNHLWGIFVFGILGSAAAWSIAALLFMLVSDGVPRDEHGRVFGLLHVSWNIAFMTGSITGGALMKIATGLPFAIAGLLNLVAIAVLFVFYTQMKAHSPAGHTETASSVA
jgi:MFS family permease